MNQHFIFTTAFGKSAVIYSVRPFAVEKVLLPFKKKNDSAKPFRGSEWGQPGSHGKAGFVSKIISNYFIGGSVNTPWELLNMDQMTGLQQKVLHAVADIPFGQVRTYGDIAKKIGRPKAYRFVGTTLAKNPFPVLIPCHRVIRSDNSIGQFGGGPELKSKMINLERNNYNISFY